MKSHLELHNIKSRLIKINIKSKLTAAHNREKGENPSRKIF